MESIYAIPSYLFTLVMRVRTRGARASLPYMPSWRVQGLHHFDFYIIISYTFQVLQAASGPQVPQSNTRQRIWNSVVVHVAGWKKNRTRHSKVEGPLFTVTYTRHSRRIFFNLLKPIGYVMHQQVWYSTIVPSAHTVFMCFVFIWEQTATCTTYSINCFVFITEKKSVYSAVRTGPLNKAVCASYLKG